MRDLRRVSLMACILIVLLRLSIGWQIAYEGLWKYASLSTPTPWTAYGYLNNAKGPLRDHFRDMTGDPDERNWLNYKFMSNKWDRWAERFSAHYSLSEAQQKELSGLLEGVERQVTTIPTETDPQIFDKTAFDYNPKTGKLSFDTWVPPIPKEFATIRSKIPSDEAEQTDAQKQLLAQLKRMEDLSVRLSYKQELKANLQGDPKVTGVVYVERREEGEERVQMRSKAEPKDHIVRVGEIQVYYDLLADYERKLQVADQDFEYDHLDTLWGKIQKKKNELVGPIKVLEKDMKQAARKLLTYEQIAQGPVPTEQDRMYQINQLTIWSLLIIGGCLMCGFLTRLMALAGAGMLLSFYLVWPPFPGVPEAPGPDHSLLVNKNVIEAIALLAIAFLPTGTWFGVDGLFAALFRRKPKQKQ